MARKPRKSSLDVLVNGRHAGVYLRESSGAISFTYEPSWIADVGLPLSRALPLRGSAQSGDAVRAVFENLLPDNEKIRESIAAKVKASGHDPHSLLSAIGRDCVGAMQFVPSGADHNVGPRLVEAKPMSEDQVARHLANLGQFPLGDDTDGAFRISIAGAQEKTALYSIKQGSWAKPIGLSPTSHILKTPMGELPNGIDLTDSVENEWLCLTLAREAGLDTCRAEIAVFQDAGSGIDGGEDFRPETEVRALVVERFDRIFENDENGISYTRIPQEDLCQALGRFSYGKYEQDGGPSMRECLELLASSENPATDRKMFLKAQIFFWMIGATDGHAKNYSIFLDPAGFSLTPLYDILSAEPSVVAGKLRHKDYQLAMAVGASRNYRMDSIAPRHFMETAKAANMPPAEVEEAIGELVETMPEAIERVASKLPSDFPVTLSEPILNRARRKHEVLEKHLAQP